MSGGPSPSCLRSSQASQPSKSVITVRSGPSRIARIIAWRDVDNVATWGYIDDGMKTVGVRELKNRLSEYIRQVRSGESVLVTDRGEVVAELTPPGHGTTEGDIAPGLRALAKRGLASLGAPSDARMYPALPRRRKRKLTAAQLLDQERGSR